MTCFKGKVIAVNGCLLRSISKAGLKQAICDIERIMKKYDYVGATDSEAERCLQVSMIYTYLSGDVCRKISWQLFDTHPDFLDAHEEMDDGLQRILGIIYQLSFAMRSKKKRKCVKKILLSYCDRLGVWQEAMQHKEAEQTAKKIAQEKSAQ